LLLQYGHYLKQLVRGDLGQSIKFQVLVRHLSFFERYPATLQLAFLALVACAAIAIPSGMLTTCRRGQTPDGAFGECAIRMIGDTR
jgi:ABC-type dipeptide/oligopeptide/nickel transport system permease component